MPSRGSRSSPKPRSPCKPEPFRLACHAQVSSPSTRDASLTACHCIARRECTLADGLLDNNGGAMTVNRGKRRRVWPRPLWCEAERAAKSAIFQTDPLPTVAEP